VEIAEGVSMILLMYKRLCSIIDCDFYHKIVHEGKRELSLLRRDSEEEDDS
jgi:hypothetical protein